MEVEPDVRLVLVVLALTDVEGHKHVLVSVDPHCVRVDKQTHLVDAPSYASVELLEFCPVV